jgi:hypothetical protein
MFRTCEGEKLPVNAYDTRCQTIPVLLPVRVMCLCVAYEVRGAGGGSQAGNGWNGKMWPRHEWRGLEGCLEMEFGMKWG